MLDEMAASKSAKPLYERAYDTIRQLIISGRLKPGDPLSEVELAGQLEISRTPVREAVRRLITENLLVLSAKGGLRVHLPTPADLSEVYFTRAVLEGAAAGLATIHADVRFVRRLSELCDLCEQAVEVDNVNEAASINGHFHRAIVEQSRNERIRQALSILDPIMSRYRLISLSFRDHLVQGLKEHRELVRCIRKKDASAVESLLRGHIMAAGGRIVRAVIRLEVETDNEHPPTMKLILKSWVGRSCVCVK